MDFKRALSPATTMTCEGRRFGHTARDAFQKNQILRRSHSIEHSCFAHSLLQVLLAGRASQRQCDRDLQAAALSILRRDGSAV